MHTLEAILQLHVATDQAATAHLPFVISNLTHDALQSSSHLPKWIARINSLIISKNAGSRWAGLCLALQTSILNKEILKECSQNWVSVCLPMLSRNEDIPNMKASMRLLDYIFFQALSTSEFQRQLAFPNVPKYSAALLNLAEKTEGSELQNSCLESLMRLVPAYPTLHRQLQSNISSFCFRLLSGKATGSDPNIINSTCSLLSVLHLTGGKVASASAWQKTLETSIANAWSAFSSVRLTFPPIELPKSIQNLQPTFKPPPSDSLIAVPLSLDRLRSASCLIIHLLKAPIYRFTAVAIGELVKLILDLLSCKSQAEEAPYDVQRRALEASAVPQVWDIACDLLSQMAISVKHNLNPSLCRILSCIAHNAEQVSDKSHRLIFIRSLKTILARTYSLYSAVLLDRLVKFLLSRLVVSLPRRMVTPSHTQESTTKRGKKRARGFDGDEVFQAGTAVICADHVDEDTLLFSLDALDLLLPNPYLSISLKSLSARLLLNLLFELSRSPATSLSHNPNFHGALYNKTLTLCRKQLTAGTAGWLNNGIGLIIGAMDRSNTAQGNDYVFRHLEESRRDLEMLLHPKLPPPLRSNPPIEAMLCFHSEPDTEDGVNSKTINTKDLRDIEMMPITPTTVQPRQKDTQVEQGPVNPATIQGKVDLSLSSGVPIPGSMKQTIGVPLVDAQLSPDTTMNVNTEANVATLQPEGRTVDISSTVAAQTSLRGSESTVASSAVSAPPQFRERAPRESVLQSAKPPDSDVDDEEIPEINLESDSD